LVVPAGLIAYGGFVAAQPYCQCVEWYTLLLPPSPGLAVAMVLALALAAIGILGAYGVLPRGLARGAKVRWSLGIAAFAWVPVLLYGCGVFLTPSSGAPNPFLSNSMVGILLLAASVAGFLALSFVLWLLSYLLDTVRHAKTGSRLT
jgi:hypothetical protein